MSHCETQCPLFLQDSQKDSQKERKKKKKRGAHRGLDTVFSGGQPPKDEYALTLLSEHVSGKHETRSNIPDGTFCIPSKHSNHRSKKRVDSGSAASCTAAGVGTAVLCQHHVLRHLLLQV